MVHIFFKRFRMIFIPVPSKKMVIENIHNYRRIFVKIRSQSFLTFFNNRVRNAIPIPKADADDAFSAAACIGCGACVAACKNSSAMLFVSAKVSQLVLLPQGKVERKDRVQKMVAQMDEEGFGNCTNTYACEAECPKLISVESIARMNRELLAAKFF
jgi:succinate dehydrogenase iron-sulfur subunit